MVTLRFNFLVICLQLATLCLLTSCAGNVSPQQDNSQLPLSVPTEATAAGASDHQSASSNSPSQGVSQSSNDLQIQIQPLFHSVAVSISNVSDQHHAGVSFKQTADNQWSAAMDLQPEPVFLLQSGSIVGLSADTEYQLRIQLYSNDQLVQTKTTSFRTRQAQPPVDPNKVYQLADIYQHGTLDLEALGIEGQEGGWAKIIGNDELVIEAGPDDDIAINIGDNSYIYFENIQVKGGRRHAIVSLNAHHLWFNGCDVSAWGRQAGDIRDGLAYENEQAAQPINYDAGFNLVQSGVIVVEHCRVHSPIPAANHWGQGHPHGATAFLASGNHPQSEFAGQLVLRYNHFIGSDQHRFNDVIESRSNGQPWGGFMQHSAIHDNVLAYANDDLIELDGGQHNVLVYNNDLQQGYTGVSAIPNRRGPSYIFQNYIHNLGDQRQRAWAAIKLGGLLSAPMGKTLIFENLIVSRSNGIAAAKFKGDSSFWVDARNNILIHDRYWQVMGYSIFDEMPLDASSYTNNYMFNLATGQPEFRARIDQGFAFSEQVNDATARMLSQSDSPVAMAIPPAWQIDNFSRLNQAGLVLIGAQLSANPSE